MDNEEKAKLIHDFSGSATILSCIASAATKFAVELHDVDIQISEKDIVAFIKRMDSIQMEIDKMQRIFDILAEG